MDTLPEQKATDAPEPRPFYPQPSRGPAIAAAAVVLMLAAGGGYYWWQQRAPAAPVAQSAPAASAPAPSAPAADAAPAIQHPIEAAPAPVVADAGGTPPSPDAMLARALVDVLGAQRVATWLQTDGFARRVVATVDNLGRVHASSQLWPVTPTAGRFAVQTAGEVTTLSPTNAARYDGFVAFVESIDAKRAAALYKQFYPQFQAAHQELGYPRGYFNDRLVAVIDQLLATPEPKGPIALRLTEVKGEVPSTRPWVRYEFADPSLESLSAGQKILVRMGNDHARRLKARLVAFRSEIARDAARR